MKVSISTEFLCKSEKMWNMLQEIDSLMFVTSPILKFVPLENNLPFKWKNGMSCVLKLYALSFIPIGKHVITIKRLDKKNKELYTNESGSIVKTWNHFIRIQKVNEFRVKYTDEIEIKSGILTIMIWLFAQLFYRYRQKRWKKLLQRISCQ